MNARRVVKGLGIVAILGVLGIVTLLGTLWLEHRTGIALPEPTGAFAVGRVIEAWVDEQTMDTLAPSPGIKRELLVWIWYPSEPAQPATAAGDYMPASMRAASAEAREPRSLPAKLMTNFLTRDVANVHSRSAADVRVSPQLPSYPVVILRAGASAGVMNYSTLAEDLASNGYIVVGIDAPYRTSMVAFPDGRVLSRTPANNPELCIGLAEQTACMNTLLAAWTADMRFALDRLEQLNASDPSGRFKGRLDLTRVGVFGHSFGGAQAAQFCHDDSRCKAGINIDGRPFGNVIQAGMNKPFMFLLSDHGDPGSADPETRQIEADIQSIYDHLPQEQRMRVAIRGANHFTFSDDGALLKSQFVRGVMRLFGALGIDGPRQLAVTSYCVREFFDAYLKGSTVSRLDMTSPLYPELRVLP